MSIYYGEKKYKTGPDDLKSSFSLLQVIAQQLVDSLIDIHSHCVFHRDIKLENILIETSSSGPRVRILDFGCGALLKDGVYKSGPGTPLYKSPEWTVHNNYTAEGTTVWQVGVTVYLLLHGVFPFFTKQSIVNDRPLTNMSLSRDCSDLIHCALKNALERPNLQRLRQHPWLSEYIGVAIKHIPQRKVVFAVKVDIKLENILIETSSSGPRVRILDFGCGALLKDGVYKSGPGTPLYKSPEWTVHNNYRAEGATVWQVGVTVYLLLHGVFPFFTKQSIVNDRPLTNMSLSRDCSDFIHCALEKDALERASLQRLWQHPWLSETRTEDDDTTGTVVSTTASQLPLTHSDV
ncbi:uncharacterized protein V6R79_007546 [Siganus canaliculatus]